MEVHTTTPSCLRLPITVAVLYTLAISSTSLSADPLDDWTVRFTGPPVPVGGQITQWDVTFGNGLFVAVGHFGFSDYGTIFTSPDGATWTPRHNINTFSGPPSIYGELRAVAFGDDRFVTCGWDGNAYTSTNGTDWIGGRMLGGAPFQVGFRDICYGQGKFVAVDGSAVSNVLTSANGLGWTRQRTGSALFRSQLIRITHGNGRFVALSEAAPFPQPARSLSSTDAITWTAVTIADGTPYLSGLTWGNGLFVAVGTSEGRGAIFSSPDGLTWTPQDFGRTNNLGQVEFINGLFIATGTSVLITSTDGIHWESRDSTNQLSRFAFGNGTLVGISGNAGSAYWGADLYQSAPLLSLEITRADPPELSIRGIVGQTCRIETDDNALGMWRPLAQFSLSSSPQVWTDAGGVRPSARLYRATWIP